MDTATAAIETDGVTMETMETTTSATEPVDDGAISMDILLIYFGVAALCLGLLLFCAIRIIFKLIFFDFFYATKEEVEEIDAERERKLEMEKEKSTKGVSEKLTIVEDGALDMPPALYMLHERYDRNRAKTAPD